MSEDELAKRRGPTIRIGNDDASVVRTFRPADPNYPKTRPMLYGSIAQRKKIILDYLAKRQRAKLAIVPDAEDEESSWKK